MLKSSGGPWLLGDSISLADLALGPVLYHATITLAEWQPQALKKVLTDHNVDQMTPWQLRWRRWMGWLIIGTDS